jgi:hypothetical protein
VSLLYLFITNEWLEETSKNLLRVAFSVCDARCTPVQLRFSGYAPRLKLLPLATVFRGPLNWPPRPALRPHFILARLGCARR